MQFSWSRSLANGIFAAKTLAVPPGPTERNSMVGTVARPQGCVSVPQDNFDERVAQYYDSTSSDRFAPAVLDPTVDLLADLARGGATLEFAVGTGRVALPLSRRGVPV